MSEVLILKLICFIIMLGLFEILLKIIFLLAGHKVDFIALLGHQTSHSQNIFFFPSCTMYYSIIINSNMPLVSEERENRM